MKKEVFAGICLSVAVCGFGCGFLMSAYQVERPIALQSDKSFRDIPDTADFGAYLAGLLARDEQDISKAAHFYERAYQGDKNNHALKTDVYLLSGLAGRSDLFIQIAKEMAKEKNTYYAPLFLSAEAIGRGSYEEALDLVSGISKTGDITAILVPVLKAWSYAGLRNEEKAFRALNVLNKKQTIGFYLYQTALLGMYFNQPEKVQKAFEQMVDIKIPTVTVLQAARYFYLRQGRWHPENPLYQVYQQTIADNPALGEILVTRADEFSQVTPAKGVAEAFFAVSTFVGGEEGFKETGLMFNQIAVQLDFEANVYKIWGAEQFESVKYYVEANRLYDSISNVSGTILFKKALNLMLMDQNEQAEEILTSLVQKAPKDVVLMVMLGNLYRDTKRPELAQKLYTKALSLTEADNKKQLTDLYFSRAMAYEALNNAPARDEDLQKALELMPNNAELLNYLGYVWIEDGQHFEKAMSHIRRAHQLAPKAPHIWDSLAWGYYKQGKPKKALSYAEVAADGMPYSALVQSHLGDIYFALGRKREAGYQYHKALDLKEDMTDALRLELEEKLKKVYNKDRTQF